MLIFGQNLPKFVSLPWKLDNPYCHSIHKPHTDSSDLFLVMKYYYEFMPNCPTKEGCSCRIPTIFNNDYKIVQDKKNYIVEVNCAGRGLKHFPVLPKWTKTLDLSDNNVSIARFFHHGWPKTHCPYFILNQEKPKKWQWRHFLYIPIWSVESEFVIKNSIFSWTSELAWIWYFLRKLDYFWALLYWQH